MKNQKKKNEKKWETLKISNKYDYQKMKKKKIKISYLFLFFSIFFVFLTFKTKKKKNDNESNNGNLNSNNKKKKIIIKQKIFTLIIPFTRRILFCSKRKCWMENTKKPWKLWSNVQLITKINALIKDKKLKNSNCFAFCWLHEQHLRWPFAQEHVLLTRQASPCGRSRFRLTTTGSLYPTLSTVVR